MVEVAAHDAGHPDAERLFADALKRTASVDEYPWLCLRCRLASFESRRGQPSAAERVAAEVPIAMVRMEVGPDSELGGELALLPPSCECRTPILDACPPRSAFAIIGIDAGATGCWRSTTAYASPMIGSAGPRIEVVVNAARLPSVDRTEVRR